MNLPMRITFDEKDYTYIVLTKEYQLVCNLKGDWDAEDATVSDHSGLLKAIGRNIKLRLTRLYFP
jgi:hypothetical protein